MNIFRVEQKDLGSGGSIKMLEENAIITQDQVWLDLVQDAYHQSTTFMDNNYRRQWDTNIRNFQSRHPAGSKYYHSSYNWRSKLFRPKTRSAIRNNEAAAVAAFFANRDVVSIEPQNENDKIQKASANIIKELIQYRLTKSIPWFLTLMGAYQDAMVPGVVISYQAWDYKERTIKEKAPVYTPSGDPVIGEDGKPEYGTFERTEIIRDQPIIELIPVENIRFHPAAKWTDPINTSPYLIELIPMYIIDIQARMDMTYPKTKQPKWKPLAEGVLKSARKQNYDITRQAREYPRTDTGDQPSGGKAASVYDVVWVHRNIMKIREEDWFFYTLGTEHLLSDPVILNKVYPHGRPYVMGISVVEAHKSYPSGLGQLGENVQTEINSVVNQRLDNVQLVMNKRYFVKRGSAVDLKSILRNAAGSVTMVNNTADDVRPIEFNDVTQSAYQEQDRLNLDFDEVVGNFSVGSIQSNRKLNETVGGMAMIRGNSNALTEYSLRTFGETWVEPTIRQTVKLEQMYETDEVILGIAADKANLFQKYGIDQITDDLLNQELTTTVTVGMGATDPVMRMQNFTIGLRVILEVLTSTPPNTLDVIEVAKEVFGYLGFKDGTRFFVKAMGQDPEKMQMQQIITQLQALIQDLQKKVEGKEVESRTKLITAGMKERGEDRRKAADIAAQMEMKRIDLLNPVAGEKIPAKKKEAKKNG